MSWNLYYLDMDSAPTIAEEDRQLFLNLVPTADARTYLWAERPFKGDIDNSEGDIDNPATILQRPELQAVNARQIAGWFYPTGERRGPLDIAAYERIRPLGNLPSQTVEDDNGEPVDIIPAGRATKLLTYTAYAGASLLPLGDDQATGTKRLYPADNQPFPGIMGQMFWDSLPVNKHGWQFELAWDFDETLRNPGQYFVCIFNDSEATSFYYQVGALYKGESAFQMDEDGNPRTVWLQNNFGTQNTVQPEDVHFAVCQSDWRNQKGRATLSANELIEQDLFWEQDQTATELALMAIIRGFDESRRAKAWETRTLSDIEEAIVSLSLIRLGFDRRELQTCDMFNGRVTAREATLRLLRCIRAGVVTPPR